MQFTMLFVIIIYFNIFPYLSYTYRKDRKGYVRRIKPSDQSDDQREESYEGGEMTLHSHHEDNEEDSLEFDNSKKQTEKIEKP